uniref:HSF-type DNA-binding domain-containing protein n=1 Tax=Dicentrarchus labrax TaxID=13489 RepID=A0A8C4HFB6_DICLA
MQNNNVCSLGILYVICMFCMFSVCSLNVMYVLCTFCMFSVCSVCSLYVTVCMFSVCSLYVHCIFTVSSVCSLYVLCMFSVCSLYVHCMFTVCSLYVLCMFTVCFLYVFCMFTVCSLYVHCMFSVCSLYVHCTCFLYVTVCSLYILCMFSVYSLYIHCIFCMFSVCSLYVFCMSLYVLCMFSVCSLYILCMFSVCSLYVLCMFTVCFLYVHCMFSVCSLYVLCMFTVCFLYVLYVHCMFSVCSLYVHCMFSVCSLYMFSVCSLCQSGTSFHVFDQGRFSKEVLPKFFKHNNMASFIRQLNMYGFRKVVHIEQGGLVKPERDDTEFQHPFFIRGQEHLLENIKRKVTNVSSVRQEEVKMSTDEVNKILNDVQLMKGKQETIDSRIIAMRHENEALWREVASLRQKHVQQQKVVNKLIQFLVSLVQSNRVLGVKRKIPLMLNDSSSTHSVPKYSRPFSLEHMQAAASLFSADSPVNSGPIISDITEVATPTAEDVVSDWTDAGESQSVNVKQEPSSPDVEVCSSLEGGALPVDTPLSPTTFINSILQDSETQLTPNTSTTNPTTASPIVLVSPASTGPLPPTPASQSPASVPIPDTAPSPSKTQQKCQTIACIDRSELSDHVDSIDNSLENLQSILNTQTFTFDTSPLMEFFSSSCPSGDFDLDSLDTLLSEEVPKGSDESTANHTGKQLVHYTATPVLMSEPISLGEGGVDLPSLLEMEAEPFFSTDPPTDDPAALLSHAHLDSDL